MDEVKITIIGAGEVGLAIAAELSKEYDSIVLVEKHEKFGQEASSRNSEVIHSGIYYPTGSLKARLCLEGIEFLYQYCKKYSIPHLRLGKLIVATEQSELINLYQLIDRGVENGVKGLTFMRKNEVSKIEPNVKALAAIYSSNTGIIDSHLLMKHLYNSAHSSGVILSFNSKVNLIVHQKDGYVIGIENDDYKFISKVVINSTGLSSDYIAELAGIDVDGAGYRLEYCKGSYFYYAKPSIVNRLVYPLPSKDLTNLGIHATLDMSGRLRFGPDAEYVNSIDYKVDENKRDVFYESSLKIIKDLDMEAFNPDIAGIRPEIKKDGFRDFIIKDELDRGLDGFINLIGINSPGLTASLAIGRDVKSIVKKILN